MPPPTSAHCCPVFCELLYKDCLNKAHKGRAGLKAEPGQLEAGPMSPHPPQGSPKLGRSGTIPCEANSWEILLSS